MLRNRFSMYVSSFLLLLALSSCETFARSTAVPIPPPKVIESIMKGNMVTPITAATTFTAMSPTMPALPVSTQTMVQTQILTLPTAAPVKTRCSEAHGRVDSLQIDSPQSSGGEAFVYLPPCYTPSPLRRYPVLYLLHGANTDNTQWVQIGAADAADVLIDAGNAPPFLIVMPEEALYTQDPSVSKYGGWIIHALVPWIDQHYPTCSERSCRAIGGLSRGGSWAFRIGLTDWRDFSAVGMDSFAPFYGDYESMPGWFQQIPPDQRPRIWLDAGSDDSLLSNTRAVAGRLDRLGISHDLHIWQGAHNRAYWRIHVPDYMKWYAQGWK